MSSPKLLEFGFVCFSSRSESLAQKHVIFLEIPIENHRCDRIQYGLYNHIVASEYCQSTAYINCTRERAKPLLKPMSDDMLIECSYFRIILEYSFCSHEQIWHLFSGVTNNYLLAKHISSDQALSLASFKHTWYMRRVVRKAKRHAPHNADERERGRRRRRVVRVRLFAQLVVVESTA